MMSLELTNDMMEKAFISGTNVYVPMDIEATSVMQEVLNAPFTLELILFHLHPRMLCRASRVCRRWWSTAYNQKDLWRDIKMSEGMREKNTTSKNNNNSNNSSNNTNSNNNSNSSNNNNNESDDEFDYSRMHSLVHPRFSRLRSLEVPSIFIKKHGLATHCLGCLQPLVMEREGENNNYYVCQCAVPVTTISRADISQLFSNFTELESLKLFIPPYHSIPPLSLSLFTSLTHLCIENLNPLSSDSFGSLIAINSHHLKSLTYLTRPWPTNTNAMNNMNNGDNRNNNNNNRMLMNIISNKPPFSYDGLQLETLEVNKLDFAEILHMASSLTSLTIRGYSKEDKFTHTLCLHNIESLVCFTSLLSLDISLLDPVEVANATWTALHVCMLTQLQRVEIGPLFAEDDFSYMSRDLTLLNHVAIHTNPNFSVNILNDFALNNMFVNLTSLKLTNCLETLAEPGCLATFPRLRSLHIQQDVQRLGTLRKLVPTIVQMTKLVDLSLVGLSINPVQIYPKLTRLTRLVLNRTPVSDADVLIVGKKLGRLQHLGLVGCYHVTLKSLKTLLLAIPDLKILEWDEMSHLKELIDLNPSLDVMFPYAKEVYPPLFGLSLN